MLLHRPYSLFRQKSFLSILIKGRTVPRTGYKILISLPYLNVPLGPGQAFIYIISTIGKATRKGG